ncbi:phosphate signaling complex protein PhoU [Tenuibacillus multivorans]|uniref:Phosphate-specific transport system accessory protein PhoU n=1 Tax=Tenuibacillus multivorans TaxID=237069 RepID=A0A1G9WQR4_9BACI|nr:phosphate signaling complex protein PhoU [Tenuibacillus multivorans]GEL77969.1 phosphate transport system regulatory protein PhoU [Tenuibacillus multivorans]SDM86770.1 phosphate transport system protein [Tenuibacillus multivorans]
MVRENFEDKLQVLKQQVLIMSEMAKVSLSQSLLALEQQDQTQAQSVFDQDNKINQIEDDINDQAIWLIAKEQPVAKDLRRLVMTLKVTNDIERIGDLAVNIAKSVLRINNEELPVEKQQVLTTASVVEQMIDLVTEAYVEEDLEKAFEIARIDDQVDRQYGDSIQKMLTYMTQHPSHISPITQLAFISRYLERAADHTTNIAEAIIYLVKGKHVDLNN